MPVFSTTRSSKRWHPDEDDELLRLRIYTRTSWAEIAILLSRSIVACRQHYAVLQKKEAATENSVDGTASDDDAIAPAMDMDMDMDHDNDADRSDYPVRQRRGRNNVLAAL
jgi:hypothetical protein